MIYCILDNSFTANVVLYVIHYIGSKLPSNMLAGMHHIGSKAALWLDSGFTANVMYDAQHTRLLFYCQCDV